jgi:hypothetical protein
MIVNHWFANWYFRNKEYHPWAITLGERVLTTGFINEWAQWHEWRHVKQWRLCGYILFPLVYGLGAVIGMFRGHYYYKNPLEIDACKYADKMAYREKGHYPEWDYLLKG